MNPLDFPLLVDENIHGEVIAFLRANGHDVQSAVEQGLIGQSDDRILRQAHLTGRVVLTHDSDMGTLAIAQQMPFTGIIYLRPGHIRPEFTIETLRTVAAQAQSVHPPFIVVAERRGDVVQIRIRQN